MVGSGVVTVGGTIGGTFDFGEGGATTGAGATLGASALVATDAGVACDFAGGVSGLGIAFCTAWFGVAG